jgi:hypothetical protein
MREYCDWVEVASRQQSTTVPDNFQKLIYRYIDNRSRQSRVESKSREGSGVRERGLDVGQRGHKEGRTNTTGQSTYRQDFNGTFQGILGADSARNFGVGSCWHRIVLFCGYDYLIERALKR